MAGDPIALHLAPHPDDEVLGAGAALVGLVDHGWQVVDLAVTLGRTEDRARRRVEVAEACRRLGLELRVLDPPLGLGRRDDHVAARRILAEQVGALVDELRPEVVVSPSPVDAHHAHVTVGRAVGDALARLDAPVWWQWGFWADLPHPTVLAPFDERRLQRCRHALDAHAGELARNDYARVLRARAELRAVLGVEQVFGFGAAGSPDRPPYAEVLTEARWRDGSWWRGEPRVLDPDAALPDRFEIDDAFDRWLQAALGPVA